MPRDKLRAGEAGQITFLALPSGRTQAMVRFCDERGQLQRVRASGDDHRDATAAVLAKVAAVREQTGGPTLGRDATIADACAVWLADKRKAGLNEEQTLETYEASVRYVVIPACGDLPLRDLTVRRCNHILADIRERLSLSSARKARSVLSQVCQTGIEYEVLNGNPVRDARRLPLPPKKTSVLTPSQLRLVRDLIRSWRIDETAGSGPRPAVHVLEHGMWIMVGTSMRIGEVLALRRRDVDVASRPATASVNGTLQQDRKDGLHRKPVPKRARQTRRIALPTFSAEAIRQQLTRTGTGGDAYLFATKTGQPLSVSNFERLLRTFVADNADALRDAGIDPDGFSTHIFRRSAATIVDAAAGISLASRLLGHANEQVTRASYVVTAELVDPLTAEIMDEAFTALLE